MKIEITDQEEEVLRKLISGNSNYSGVLIKDGMLGVSDDLANDLRDDCSDYLQEVGFDKDYRPTEAGRTLESLIDKLFTG